MTVGQWKWITIRACMLDPMNSENGIDTHALWKWIGYGLNNCLLDSYTGAERIYRYINRYSGHKELLAYLDYYTNGG